MTPCERVLRTFWSLFSWGQTQKLRFCLNAACGRLALLGADLCIYLCVYYNLPRCRAHISRPGRQMYSYPFLALILGTFVSITQDVSRTFSTLIIVD